ncbi:MAG: hypothetical protein V4629_01530 [Pseudomonadota bacterium]
MEVKARLNNYKIVEPEDYKAQFKIFEETEQHNQAQFEQDLSDPAFTFLTKYSNNGISKNSLLNRILQYPIQQCNDEKLEKIKASDPWLNTFPQFQNEINDQLNTYFKLRTMALCKKEERHQIIEKLHIAKNFFNVFHNSLQPASSASALQKKVCRKAVISLISKINLNQEVPDIFKAYTDLLSHSMNCFRTEPTALGFNQNQANFILWGLLILLYIGKLRMDRVNPNVNPQVNVNNPLRFRPIKMPWGEISYPQLLNYLTKSAIIKNKINEFIIEKLEEDSPDSNEWEQIGEQFVHEYLCTIMFYSMTLPLKDSKNNPIILNGRAKTQTFDLPLLLKKQNQYPAPGQRSDQFADDLNILHAFDELDYASDKSLPALLKKLCPDQDFSEALKTLVPDATGEQIYAVRVLCGLENIH